MVGILLKNIWNSITIYAACYFQIFKAKCHINQALHINMPCNVYFCVQFNAYKNSLYPLCI